jgi:hypothetical protein
MGIEQAIRPTTPAVKADGSHEPTHECRAIDVVRDDGAGRDTPCYYVVDRSWRLDARLSGHHTTVPASKLPCKTLLATCLCGHDAKADASRAAAKTGSDPWGLTPLLGASPHAGSNPWGLTPSQLRNAAMFVS